MTKALEDALGKMGSPKSQLHRDVKRSLEQLSKNWTQLEQSFRRRAAKREERAGDDMRRSVATAEEQMAECKASAATLRKLGNETLGRIAEDQLEFARRQIQVVKTAGATNKAIVDRENGIEQHIQDWYGQLVENAAGALWSDVAGDRTIAILSGGLIVAGVATGPIGAIAAAAGSGALLAADSNLKLRQSKRVAAADETAERTERALVLLTAAVDLSEMWLQILRASDPR